MPIVRPAAALALLAAAAALPARAAPVPPCPDPQVLGTARDLPVGGAPRLGLKTYPQTLDLADREVVLTFDDGPSPVTTPGILDTLARNCVRATFFLIGRNAAAHPALVRRELALGHSLGHHTWSHPAATLRGLGFTEARADIERGMEADDKAAYGAWTGTPRVPFFRFPGFADTPALLDDLEGRGIAVFGADLWASDWVPMAPDAELKLLMARLDAAGRGIILLHDIKAETAAMLPGLMTALKAGRYRIVHLVPGPALPPLRPAPANWVSETERTLEQEARGRTARLGTVHAVKDVPGPRPAPTPAVPTPAVPTPAVPTPAVPALRGTGP